MPRAAAVEDGGAATLIICRIWFYCHIGRCRVRDNRVRHVHCAPRGEKRVLAVVRVALEKRRIRIQGKKRVDTASRLKSVRAK